MGTYCKIKSNMCSLLKHRQGPIAEVRQKPVNRKILPVSKTNMRVLALSFTGLLVAIGKIKHFFKATFLKNKALLKHFLWTAAQCIIMKKGIDLN